MEQALQFAAIYVMIPLIAGLGAFIMRSSHARLDKLEQEQRNKIERKDVVDMLEPLREDVQELKAKLDKIVDILLKR